MSAPGSKPPPPRRHAIGDHALGALIGHVHGPEDADHDHDHDGLDGLLAHDGADALVLTSIGVDIGSSGTQVAFARLHLQRAAGASRAEVPADLEHSRLATRQRETLYQSPVFLTPFLTGNRIDDAGLGRIMDGAFAGAGLAPDDIDCGVVILTGAARERENAAAISHRLAETCGDIVSASAGHHMEARLAAYGSGAVQRSAEFAQRFLNIDIGGATTKLAICEHGRVTATAALAIGGRLVATDRDDRIVRLEPTGRDHALRMGFDWQLGGSAPWPERQAAGAVMAELLIATLKPGPPAEAVASLYLTEPLPGIDGIDAIMISGGVGEYVYGRETRSFGDLGLALGRALARRIDAGALPWPLMPAAECIRATVLGASSYSVQLSGRTGCMTNPAALLPRRNLPVLHPPCALGEPIDSAAVAQGIGAHLAAFDLDGEATPPQADAVFAFRWQGSPEYGRLRAFAEGLKRGFSARLDAGLALYLVIDGDIAGTLGAILRDELSIANDLLVLDGIALDDFDFVDLGRIRLPSQAVPVTIKTLVFPDEHRQILPHARNRSAEPR